MRLINVDALKKDLKAVTMSNGTIVNTNTMIALLDKYPTAYDIRKVVEELGCDRCENCSFLEVCAGSKCCTRCHEKIIEIVKQGCVSDDVCEWISVSDGEFIQNPHTKRLYSNEPSMKNIYCNTCGKKIKVM